jgi:hypothetical protein
MTANNSVETMQAATEAASSRKRESAQGRTVEMPNRAARIDPTMAEIIDAPV